MENNVQSNASKPTARRAPLQLYTPPYLRQRQTDAMAKSVENVETKTPTPSRHHDEPTDASPLPIIIRRSKPSSRNNQNRLSMPSFRTSAVVSSVPSTKRKSVYEPFSKKQQQQQQPSDVSNNRKKVGFAEADVKKAEELFRHLTMSDDKNVIAWLEGKCSSGEQAASIAQVLVQLAIEGDKAKATVAKLCHLLLNCASAEEFRKGLVAGCNQYFDRRDKLRQDYCACWLQFMSFSSELCTDTVFTSYEELAGIVFSLFNYLLSPSVIDSIKMEELEYVISSLLNVGYGLERQYPDRLTELKNTFRNSFLQAKEPWVRKMILLLIELSAGNWRLSDNASRYYYYQTSTNAPPVQLPLGPH